MFAGRDDSGQQGIDDQGDLESREGSPWTWPVMGAVVAGWVSLFLLVQFTDWVPPRVVYGAFAFCAFGFCIWRCLMARSRLGGGRATAGSERFERRWKGMATIRIVTDKVQMTATLNESESAKTFYDALPIEGSTSRWGDEVYFDIGLSMPEENPQAGISHASSFIPPPARP